MPPHLEGTCELNAEWREFFARQRIKGSRKRRSRSASLSSLSSKSSRSRTPSGSGIKEINNNNNVYSISKITTDSAIPGTVVEYHEAPDFLQFNPYILSGYRVNLDNHIACLRSAFWWTNETLNIWTHLLSAALFGYLMLAEFLTPSLEAEHFEVDRWVIIFILFCFKVCTFLSALYHVFSCHSEHAYQCWLSRDLFGISVSLLAIYFTGIYYAFWCQPGYCIAYLSLVGIMFAGATLVQITPKLLRDEYATLRLIIYMAWSAFGFVPCLHWMYQHNGWYNELAHALVGRIFSMYLICGIALFFYITRIPEVFFPGAVDYIGASHQWWHVIIAAAFYHWHHTSLEYANFRATHGCFEFGLAYNHTLA